LRQTVDSVARFFSAPLTETDPQLAAALGCELDRQRDGIEPVFCHLVAMLDMDMRRLVILQAIEEKNGILLYKGR